jgi:hypothetical protein
VVGTVVSDRGATAWGLDGELLGVLFAINSDIATPAIATAQAIRVKTSRRDGL